MPPTSWAGSAYDGSFICERDAQCEEATRWSEDADDELRRASGEDYTWKHQECTERRDGLAEYATGRPSDN